MTSVPDTAEPGFARRRTRAIASAYLGFMMDSYSILIPSIALVPAIAYFQDGINPGTAAFVAAMTLAATLLGRPLGAFIFGALSDKIGRQRVGFITIMGFGIVTILIAMLPGAQLVGATTAMTLLVVLRFIDGIFLGGEYTAATPMAVEYAPAKRRGLFGGLVQSSAASGQVLGSLVTVIVLAFATSGDLSSPYTQWGWRIPFVVGGILAILTAVFLRREVEDSEVQKKAKRVKNPIRSLFTPGPNLSALVQVFVIMNGVFLMINLNGGVLAPAILIRNADKVNAVQYTMLGIITGLIAILGYVGSGWLSDRIGRKRAMAWGAVASGIVGPIAIWLVVSASLPDLVSLGVALALSSIVVGGVVGVAPSYFNERFPTSVRSSGWGIGYSTAIILPSFAAIYIAALESFLPVGTGGAVLWVLGAVLVLIGLTLGPETRGIDLAQVAETNSEHSRSRAPIASA